MRELKKAMGRRLLKSGAPKRLWYYCLELESLIRSFTAHDIFKPNGRTPEAMMMGETPDISYICELGWYDWVMFCDSCTISCAEDGSLAVSRSKCQRWSCDVSSHY
jgi:hypothetical protein